MENKIDLFELKKRETIYNRNRERLFAIQRKIDEQIRKEICSKCTSKLKKKRGCVDHYGKKFCKLLIKKRKEKKKLNYAWQFNLLSYSPIIYKSKLLSKIANSIDIIT